MSEKENGKAWKNHWLALVRKWRVRNHLGTSRISHP